MNSPFELTNAIARQACGMAPLAATQWPMKAPKAIRGDTVEITFHGLELVVELDYMGRVDGVMAASDGTEIYGDFNPATIEEIAMAAKTAQMEAA